MQSIRNKGAAPRRTIGLPPDAQVSPAATQEGHAPEKRVSVLDGLRGIAILLVMIFHFWKFGMLDIADTSQGPLDWAYAGAAGIGKTGVDLFFVLSGFLITGILYQSRANANYYSVFYARRAVRIFPAYYLSLGIFSFVLPLLLHWGHRADASHDLFLQAPTLLLWTFLSNWKYVAYCSPLVQHFWSLAVEAQFYLFWPWIVRSLDRRGLMVFCIGLIFMSLGFRVLFSSILMLDWQASYEFTVCRVDSLAAGAFIALGFMDSRGRDILRNVAPFGAWLALLGLLFAPHTGPISAAISYTPLLFGSCLVMALCLQEGTTGHRILSSRLLRFFGKYSYALYIFHQSAIILLVENGVNVQSLTTSLHSRFWAIVSVNGAAFLVSTALAILSWYLVEKHFLKLKALRALRYDTSG